MPFVEVPVEDAKEAEIVPEGEYEVRCDGIIERRNKDNTRDMLIVPIAIVDAPKGVNPATIFHQIALPNAEDEPKSREFMLLLLRRFLELFKVPYEGAGFNTDDIPGSTAKCFVEQNEYKKTLSNILRIPQMKKESAKKSANKVA